MSEQIYMDYSRVEAAGQNFLSAAKEFQNTYRGISEAVNAMSTCWSGVDNQRYVQSFRSCEGDLSALQRSLEGYGQFLVETAQAYRRTQQQLADAAGALGTKGISIFSKWDIVDMLLNLGCGAIAVPSFVSPSVGDGVLKVSISTVNQTSLELMKYAAQSRKIFAEAEEYAAEVRAAWQSDASESFRAAFARILPRFESINRLLVQYADFLQEVVKAYSEMEKAATANAAMFQ